MAVKLSQVFLPLLVLAFVNSPTCNVDDHHEQSQSGQNQQSPQPHSPQGESNAGDSSRPLFSLYSKIAKEQDDDMTNRWQQDAKDILIFVSGPVSILTETSIKCTTTDRSIFCCCFRATRRIRPRPQAEFTRYLCSLSREYLSSSRPRRSKHYLATLIHSSYTVS